MKVKKREESILNMYNSNKFYSDKAYLKLYKFFVTNSLVDDESFSHTTLKSYGWSSNIVEGQLEKELKDLEIFKNIYLAKSISDLYDKCDSINLSYNKIGLENEQAVIVKDNNNFSLYYVCYAKVRDALAHGNFRVQKNKKGIYMFVAEDYSSQGNLNARMVVKVKTLENIVDIVDRNKTI